jgi:glutaminyl-peptide cyclotransferase
MLRLAFSFLLIICISFLFGSCDSKKESKRNETPTIAFKLKSSWPHDTQSFTQGLVIHDGKLYESTGQEGKSWIGIVDIKTGKPDKKVTLDKKYFGEGIAILNDKVFQLTWTSKVGFVYDLKTFEKLKEFEIPSKEGWGITHDSKNLILSDGTSKLTFLDTATLKPVKTLLVTDENGDVDKINELEYVNGYVLANIWETNIIVRIDPQTGKVVARMDLGPLMQNAKMLNAQADVLNGIAYHSSTKLLLVTGKYWPKIYALQLLN